MTNEAPTNKGLLTDKEGIGFPGCRILIDGEQADRPFIVLPHVQKYLDNIPKESQVAFETKGGKISKIWEDKPHDLPKTSEVMTNQEVADMKARADKAHAEKQAAQATDKPLEAGVKIVQGQITAIDAGLHTITVKDKAGTHHEMVWAAPLVEKMAKLKQWFFVTISAEKTGEYWKVIDQTYFKKPDDWPVSQNNKFGGGKGNWQPRNERPIIMQVIFKEACETARQFCKLSDTFDSAEADAAWEWAVAKTEATMERLCKAGGV